MLDSYTDRVRFVRSLTKLSREAFEEKYTINRNTLKAWELGINTLTEKSAKALSNAINEEGFSCSPQWLIFGQGSEPKPLREVDDKVLVDEINHQSNVIYEADYFKKNNPNSIICMITDKSMVPEFKAGDYVGGINIDFVNTPNQLIGSSCIVSLGDSIILVRKLILAKNEYIVLCPLNTQYEADIVRKKDIIAIANIIWCRTIFTRPANES